MKHFLDKFKFLYIILVVGFSFFLANLVSAQEVNGFVVTPHIIDEQALSNDLFKYEVKIKNNNAHKKSIFILVGDLYENAGKKQVVDNSELDKYASITRWTKIKRSQIWLESGEEITLPLEINIAPRVAAGKYYAFIDFVESANRYEAENKLNKSEWPEILINFEVIENVIEKSQLKAFTASKKLFIDFPIEFNFELDNVGNKSIIPSGFVYIINRKGEEVTNIDVNSYNVEIAPNEKQNFEIALNEIKKFGKFKARLEVEYGDSRRDIQDVIYFWYIPKFLLIIIGITLFLLIFILTYILFKKTYHYEEYEEENGQVTDQQPSVNQKETVINLKEEVK